MKKGGWTVTEVLVVVLVGAFFLAIAFPRYWAGKKAGKVTITNPLVDAGTNGVTEIGWRPMISGIQVEKMSGVIYVVVSTSADTNDTSNYRECFVEYDPYSGKPLPSRVNPKTGLQEVYVIERVFWPDRVEYFAMRNARFRRADK